MKRPKVLTDPSLWFTEAKKEEAAISVTDERVLEKLHMLQLTEFDLQLLKKIRPFVFTEIDSIATKFYSSVYEINGLREIIDHYSSVPKLSKTLAVHVMEIFDGVIDDAFLERRYRVGKIHYRIRLTPSYYMGAFENLQRSITALVFRQLKQPEIAERVLEALNKMLSFEQQVVLEAYDAEYNQLLKKEFEEGRSDLKASISDVSNELRDLTQNTNDLVRRLQDHLNDFVKISNEEKELRIRMKSQAASGFEQLGRLLKSVDEANRSIIDMGRMVEDMDQASSRINQVTQLVKGLAEQTNILSLNSAIEAARAGEYGKGFTVVSQEIRKLAEKTNTAMAQISELVSSSAEVTAAVDDSLKKVTTVIEKGVAESGQTGQQFQGIISSVEENATLAGTVDEHMQKLREIAANIGKGSQHLSESAEQLMKKL